MGLATCRSVNPGMPIILMVSQQRRPWRSHAYREQAMTFDKLSRRHVLQGTAALTLGTALPLRGAFAADTTVGFIYVGSRDDYGYNQAHAAGAAALKKMPGIKVVEEEKVPETDAVEKTMESMINLDGATLLFPTSFGYFNPHMLKMAAKYPEAPLRALRRPVDREGSEERRQLFRLHRRGAACQRHRRRPHVQIRQARLRRRQADSAGAAQHQRVHARRQARQPESHDAGDLHRRLVDAGEGGRSHQQPDRSGRRRAHLPRRRPEDRGRERRRAAAPWSAAITSTSRCSRRKAYLTGAEWNWEVLYPRFVKMFTSGETIPNFYRGGLKEGLVKVSPYGAMVSDAAQEEGRRGQGEAHGRQLCHLQGPDHGQQGQDRDRRRRRARGQTDPELEKMNYLVEGVIGATS